MNVKGPIKINGESKISIRLYNDRILCGFPSPAEGYSDEEIDFNRYILDNPATSFCFYVKGDSMEGLHIVEGDLIVVDRSRTPVSGNIVICSIDDSFTLKKFKKKGERYYLLPANILYEPIEVTDLEDFQCWGVATRLIRKI